MTLFCKWLAVTVVFLFASLQVFAQKTYGSPYPIQIPPKSDTKRWQLIYETESNIKNKFKDNAFEENGAYYSSFIPDNEDIDEHLKTLIEIKEIYKDIQGCMFYNPAIFNGMSLEDLQNKVLAPAKKIAKNQKIGSKQNTLVFMVFAPGADRKKSFKFNLASDAFTCKKDSIGRFNFSFEEAFYEHYDNILVMQPNDYKSADETLDTLFLKLENCLEEDTKIDILFMGHGLDKKGVKLSINALEDCAMDISDFYPLEKGGNQFAQNMKNIFIKSINCGYNPRIIGIGCCSEFMQTAIDMLMPEEYVNYVKVFGTPFNTFGCAVLGFNNGWLEFASSVDLENNSIYMVVSITDGNYKKQNDKKVHTFSINSSSTEESGNNHILNQYYENNIKSGWLSKESGVSMEYVVVEYDKGEK